MAQATAHTVAHAEGQQHPIKLYLVVWGWLFILSLCSYLVERFQNSNHMRPSKRQHFADQDAKLQRISFMDSMV